MKSITVMPFAKWPEVTFPWGAVAIVVILLFDHNSPLQNYVFFSCFLKTMVLEMSPQCLLSGPRQGSSGLSCRSMSQKHVLPLPLFLSDGV